MQRKAVIRITFLLALLALCGRAALNAQATKNVFLAYPAGNLTTPIGIAYSPILNKLLVTQPFCGRPNGNFATGFNVTAIDPNGNTSLFANLLPQPLSTDPNSGHVGLPYSACFEDHIAVSPGLGGFPANDVYVTQGGTISHIPAIGGTPSLFATVVGVADTHVGITFDTVGTFCHDMILTGGKNGLIVLVDSSGNQTPYTTVLGTVSNMTAAVEGATVAPMTFTGYPGWLLVNVEASPSGGGVIAIPPPTSCSALHPAFPASGVVTRISNQPSPEKVNAVPTTAATCDFGHALPTGGFAGGSYFVIGYTGGVSFEYGGANPYAILAYPASNFAHFGSPSGPSLIGDIMVPSEYNTPPTTYLTPTADPTQCSTCVTSHFFDSAPVPGAGEQEDATFAGCPVNLGCVLTPGGYKNHFKSKVTPLFIGGQTYTASQVLTIVSTGGGGLNALARSLATALLNIEYGAFATAPVQDAIAQAQQEIYNITTAIGKTIFTTTQSLNPDPQNTIIDNWNNGSGGQKECTQ